MNEGYCVKCKATQTILNAVEDSLKNGRSCVRGKCPICGTAMYKMVGGRSEKALENGEPDRAQPASGCAETEITNPASPHIPANP